MDIINVNDVCLTLGKTEILKHINVSFERARYTDLSAETAAERQCL